MRMGRAGTAGTGLRIACDQSATRLHAAYQWSGVGLQRAAYLNTNPRKRHNLMSLHTLFSIWVGGSAELGMLDSSPGRALET